MVNWSALAGQKYDIMQQQADTAAAAQRSQAGLQAAQANSLGMLAPAQVAEMKARGGLYNAHAGVATQQGIGLGLNNKTLDRRNQAEIGQIEAQTGVANQTSLGLALGMNPAGGALTGQIAHNAATQGINPNLGVVKIGQSANLSSSPQSAITPDELRSFYGGGTYDSKTNRFTAPSIGMKKGTSRVPGKGDGTKDTVNAKLAPGEAVLNKAAAEHMGRGLIEALNKLGAEKMGMVPTTTEDSVPRKYAAGTEEVQPLDDVRGSSFDDYTKRLHFADPARRATRLENDIADVINNARVRRPGEKSQAKNPY